ncbi:RNA polymerase subunit sigma-70 [Nonlabens tegetincola]|nr:RNA polymerase subunit sigma-70 [Nonlabens tegetincola]
MKVISLYTNEKKLIQKAAKNDRKAQKQIFDKHAPRMLSVCRQYISPVETAEEIMLNGFFKAFKNIKKYNHNGSFEGWLRRIMVNSCLDHLRKKNPFKFAASIDEVKDETDDDGMDDCNLEMHVLQSVIDALPIGYKSVFLMHVVDGYKHHEIAEILDISVNTSKTQLRKAKLQLQQEIISLKRQQYEA